MSLKLGESRLVLGRVREIKRKGRGEGDGGGGRGSEETGL